MDLPLAGTGTVVNGGAKGSGGRVLFNNLLEGARSSGFPQPSRDPEDAASGPGLHPSCAKLIPILHWRRILPVPMLLFHAATVLCGAPPPAAAPTRAERVGVEAPPVGTVAQPSGTKRMIELLRRTEREANPQRNPFLNERRVALMRAAAAAAPQQWSQPNERFRMAGDLLNAGESKAALEQIEAAEQFLKRIGAVLSPNHLKQVRDLKAITLLRLAEQENCCAQHNQDSCIVPIRGQGIHTVERGSRGAIDILMQMLEADPSDLQARWLLNIASMTLNQYPDGVPQKWLIPPKAFESDYDIGRFYDVAGAHGLDVVGLSGGAILEDFDGDGNLDVMCSSVGLLDQLRYFRNNGDGTFTERTAEAGLLGITGGLNMIHADYDNDGDPDVIVLRGAWLVRYGEGRHPNSLLRNNGNGTFEDVTEAAGMLSFHPTQTAAWGDYDNDGWLDLFIGNESFGDQKHPCELYHNNRDGTFTERAAKAGVAHEGFIKGVAFGDYNNDGLPDLYLSNLMGPNVLFHNDGGGLFSDKTKSAGVAEPLASFPTWFFDYDNDGWLDIFACGYRSSAPVSDVAADYLRLPHTGILPKLYRNQANGKFADVTSETKLNRLLMAMGANHGDLDNDGWTDFYLGTGWPDFQGLVPNRMFRNAEGKYFQDVTTSGGFGNIQKGHAIAFGDIDNDGDQDIYVVMGGAYSGDVYHKLLFENPGHGNHWITLRLRGVRTNRSAIGARVKVIVETEQGSRDIHVLVGTGGSFGSSSLQQEIGLGKAKSIRLVEVYWPGSATRQTFTGLSMDRVYDIREGEAQPLPVQLRGWPSRN